MRRIVFTPAARKDLIEALDWYAKHAPVTVRHMRAELRALVLRLGTAPHQFPVYPRETRRALMHRFPYVVIFRITDDAIDIIAFFHTSRDPVQWQRRI
jgi:plasmid stabilization system protein ParE